MLQDDFKVKITSGEIQYGILYIHIVDFCK